MFDRPFSFEGRIRRTEYGLSVIIYTFLSMTLSSMIKSGTGEDDFLLFGLIPLLWFMWSQGARRCHDLGNSGWWQLIPFYGLWLLFQDGQRFPNTYGENPKGINDYSYSFERDYSKTVLPTAESEQIVLSESNSTGTILLEVQNASYSNLQDIIKQLRNINGVSQMSSEYINTTGEITIQYNGTSQKLLEELLSIRPDMEVLQVKNGHIIIKL